MESSGEVEQQCRTSARQSLSNYRAGSETLGRLISNLETIFDRLEASEWKDSIVMEWSTLEIAYSVALDRGELEIMPVEMKLRIEEAIANLENLLRQNCDG